MISVFPTLAGEIAKRALRKMLSHRGSVFRIGLCTANLPARLLLHGKKSGL